MATDPPRHRVTDEPHVTGLGYTVQVRRLLALVAIAIAAFVAVVVLLNLLYAVGAWLT